MRFVQVPGALEALGSDAPPSLTVTFNATELSIGAGGKTMATEASLPDGAMIALAVSDAPATVHSLVIDAKPADKWAADAAVRVTARRALARLRDFAAAGLLAGLQGRYPDAQKALADYSTAQSQQRARAANLPPLDRATELMAIADALSENGLAAYEGGLAALMAGATEHGHSLLKRAAELSSSHAARLALAEAQRRMGLREQAARTLADCKESLPDDLRPELALLEARLMADRGELGDARARLEAASARHPAHQQLAAFTESARLLTQRTDMAAASVPGPLGLRLLSDMPDDRLRALVRRLKPYVQQFRTWLPQLPEGLRGNVVLFSGPVEYLNAALLVAGDNLDNIAGMFIPQGMQGMPTVMATRAFGEDELLRTLVHELWHLCLRAVPPGEAIPRWIDEGMAVMLSAGRAGANGLRFDCLPEEFAGVQDFAAVAADGANLAAALKATPVEFYQAGPVRAHYAAAWAAVWHLAGDQARAADLRRALAGDEKATKALAEQVPRQAEAIGKAIAALK